jgi:hypothetical protein
VFALSGGAATVEGRLDLFGVLVLSFAAANAGGLTRDLLIGAVPPAAISDWRYPGVSLLVGLVTFLWCPMLDRLRSPLLVFDGAGLAPSSEGAPCPAGSGKPRAPAQTASWRRISNAIGRGADRRRQTTREQPAFEVVGFRIFRPWARSSLASLGGAGCNLGKEVRRQSTSRPPPSGTPATSERVQPGLRRSEAALRPQS